MKRELLIQTHFPSIKDLQKQIIENGWYLAHIGDDLFEMETPEGFVAKTYAV